MPMIATTTKSSTSVKPWSESFIRFIFCICAAPEGCEASDGPRRRDGFAYGEASRFPGLAAFIRLGSRSSVCRKCRPPSENPHSAVPCTPRGDGDIAAREPMTMLLRGATLIDGTGADPLRSAAVRIEGDRIAAVRDGGRAEQLLDIEGCTLLPGLIGADPPLGIAYNSAEGARAGMVPAAEIAAGIFENCGLALDYGFTTCRDMAGLDGGIVQAIAKGMVRGPRILPSATALAQDGGHGTFMAPWSDCHCSVSIPGLIDAVAVCNGTDEVRLAARRAFRRGARQLKLFLSGGVISLTD